MQTRLEKKRQEKSKEIRLERDRAGAKKSNKIFWDGLFHRRRTYAAD
jgi:hypothetical protein